MILKAAAILALLGFGIGAYFEPDMLLPESNLARVLSSVLFLLMLAVPVQTAYRLRKQLDEFSGLPSSDRELILELRRAAGRATNRYTTFIFPTLPRTTESLERLQAICGDLRHYPGIYGEGTRLCTLLWYIASLQGTMGDVVQVATEAGGVYQRLLRACDELLQPPAEQRP